MHIYTQSHVSHTTAYVRVCVRVYSVIYCRQHTHPSLIVNCLQTTTACYNDHCTPDTPVLSIE